MHKWIASLLVSAAVMSVSPTAIAESGGSSEDDTIEAGAGSGTGSTSDDGDGDDEQECSYVALTYEELLDLIPFSDISNGLDGQVTLEQDGTTYKAWWQDCPAQPRLLRLFPVAISVDVLATQLYNKQRRTIPLPTPDMSPATRGIVQLGLWLAVDVPAVPSAFAESGPNWARVTATLSETRFDFGNGDSVTCEGGGTPIVDTSVVEQGPCGYTYTETSDPDHPFQLAVTMTWTVWLDSSAGSRALIPIIRTTTIDYPVVEVQTVGVG